MAGLLTDRLHAGPSGSVAPSQPVPLVWRKRADCARALIERATDAGEGTP